MVCASALYFLFLGSTGCIDVFHEEAASAAETALKWVRVCPRRRPLGLTKSDSRRISRPSGPVAAFIFTSAGLLRSSFIGTAKRTLARTLGGVPLTTAEASAKVSRHMTPGT